MKLRYEVEEIDVHEYLGYKWVWGIPDPKEYQLGGIWHNEAGPTTYSGRNHRYYLGNEMIVKIRA